MYDPYEVLASLDRNMWPVLGLCGFAMLCNYTWFFAAVRQGFRDQVVPVPLFCTFFWLAGDASMVMRFDLWFNVIGHWYVKLFWLALVFTVICELIFVWMTLRFGRKEFAPGLSQGQFTLLVLLGIAAMWIAWELVKGLIGDPLYINYFHLANLAGPPLAAAQLFRRGNRAGTSPLIWGAYTLMVASWFTACALWYGGPFASPGYIGVYVFCTGCAAAMTVAVARMPAYVPPASTQAARADGAAAMPA